MSLLQPPISVPWIKIKLDVALSAEVHSLVCGSLLIFLPCLGGSFIFILCVVLHLHVRLCTVCVVPSEAGRGRWTL